VVSSAGLSREPGTVRTFTSCVTACALSSAMNWSSGQVECPIVRTTGGHRTFVTMAVGAHPIWKRHEGAPP
jgi:hypothetical protein